MEEAISQIGRIDPKLTKGFKKRGSKKYHELLGSDNSNYSRKTRFC
ncbi:MAG: hypothetical protein WCX30_02030 [Candidatus Paceibacterota bacterium]|jgi:hypothetical protein|nr:hypothetical protein [bacterium]